MKSWVDSQALYAACKTSSFSFSEVSAAVNAGVTVAVVCGVGCDADGAATAAGAVGGVGRAAGVVGGAGARAGFVAGAACA